MWAIYDGTKQIHAPSPHSPPPGPVSLPMFGICLISLKETFSKLHKLASVQSNSFD